MTPLPSLLALPLGVPLAGIVLGAVALGAAIIALVRIARTPAVARAELIAEQTMQLDHVGSFRLCLEGPHFSTRFRGLSFTLHDAATGADVPLHVLVMRTQTSGFSTVRLAVRRFEISRPGPYVLRIDGLASDPLSDDCAIVITPRLGPRLPLTIVACVLAAILTIGSIVATALRLAP